MYFTLLAITFIGIVLHLAFSSQERTAGRIVEVTLVWALAVMVGVGGIIAFVAHAFFPDATAAYIGWPAGSPFQFEVAVADLSYGILGIMAVWLRGHFWTAVVAAQSIFFFGCAAGHLRQHLLSGNAAPGNMGPALLNDVALPIVLIALLVAYHRTSRRKLGV